jgi:hypothetical protein
LGLPFLFVNDGLALFYLGCAEKLNNTKNKSNLPYQPSSRAGFYFFSTAKKSKQKMPPLTCNGLKSFLHPKICELAALKQRSFFYG